jgi:hypothetical protein
LKHWFERADAVEAVHSLYFGTLYRSELYPHHRFLSLIQAAESFHRIKEVKDPEAKALNRRRKKAVVMAAPIEHRKWLHDELKFSRYPTFETRLRQLLANFQGISDGSFGDPCQFLQDLKDTRNYYTHYGEELKKKAADGARLLILTERLRILVELCLLADIGFELDEISEMLDRTGRIKVLNRSIKFWERIAAAEGDLKRSDAPVPPQ